MRDSRSTREDVNDGVNCYDTILDKMAEIPGDADIIAMGDWNGRIGERPEIMLEFVNSPESTINDPVLNFHEFDIDNIITENDLTSNNLSVTRKSKDGAINDYGVKLLNLCQTVNLCVLNGRACEDKDIGEYTFCSKRGKSCIDFVLCNKSALYKILNFHVKSFNSFSDHSVIGFDIKYTKTNSSSNVPVCKYQSTKLSIARWNAKKKDEYIDVLKSEIVQNDIAFISDKLLKIMTCEVVDSSIEQLNSILKTAGKSHIKEVHIGLTGRDKVKKGGGIWYDSECKKQSKIFKECETKFRDTGSEEDRVYMCEQRSIYRALCRTKKREFNQGEASKMVKLSKSDPKRFWREIKGNKIRERAGECNFYEHFKDLANKETRVGQEGIQEMNREDINNYKEEVDILDRPIEFKEVEKAIKSLKSNKAAGPDNLINEFFLNATTELKNFL